MPYDLVSRPAFLSTEASPPALYKAIASRCAAVIADAVGGRGPLSKTGPIGVSATCAKGPAPKSTGASSAPLITGLPASVSRNVNACRAPNDASAAKRLRAGAIPITAASSAPHANACVPERANSRVSTAVVLKPRIFAVES